MHQMPHARVWTTYKDEAALVGLPETLEDQVRRKFELQLLFENERQIWVV